MTSLSALQPSERIAAIADEGSVGAVSETLSAPRPSPHLSRWALRTQADDGVAVAAGTLHGQPVLLAAQDERYLGGAVGAQHAAALHELFAHALRTRPSAVVLLCASGGVRLHEANAAEMALARALTALLELRMAGVPVLALAVGNVFGGASVVACAADRLGMLPRAQLGLSGPKVIATARGEDELDPHDVSVVARVFGAATRTAHGDVDLVADRPDVVRSWLDASVRSTLGFEHAVLARHAALDAEELLGNAGHEGSLPPAWRPLLEPVVAAVGLWRVRERNAWILASDGTAPLDARRVHAQDTALLEHVRPVARGGVLLLVEDTPGHDASVAAEEACLSRHLAHRAEVLALLRHEGMHVRTLLAGCGHSAAFFANGLQAQDLVAWRGARVMAMDPAAVARVTKLPPAALAQAIREDPVLGHDVACFAQWGGVRAIVDEIGAAELEALTAPRYSE